MILSVELITKIYIYLTTTTELMQNRLRHQPTNALQSIISKSSRLSAYHQFQVQYFSIDNAHPNIFVAPFDVEITHICQLAVVRKYRGWKYSLKAHALLVVIVVILSLMKNFLDFNGSIFNKY
jgi:hypothetical protein